MDTSAIAPVVQTGLVAPDTDSMDLASMELGVVRVRGVGADSILKLLDFGEPATRVVPRSIEQDHVDALYRSVYGSFDRKNDHIWPVYLECSARFLSADTLEAMKHGSAHDTTWCPPMLRLVSGGGPLDLDLNERSPLQILDGGHRLAVLVQESVRFKEIFRRLRDKNKEQGLDKTEKARLDCIVDSLDANTWRCIVFDSDLLTDEARHYLSSYEDE